jgi:hypothetical protein
VVQSALTPICIGERRRYCGREYFCFPRHPDEGHPSTGGVGVLIACGCYLATVDFVKTGLLRKLPQGL